MSKEKPHGSAEKSKVFGRAEGRSGSLVFPGLEEGVEAVWQCSSLGTHDGEDGAT
jgi:hypothetical protein